MLFIQFHQQMPEIWAPQRKTCVFNVVLNEVLTAKMSTLSAYIFENTGRIGMCSISRQRKKCGEHFQIVFIWGHQDTRFVTPTTGPGYRNWRFHMRWELQPLEWFSTLFSLKWCTTHTSENMNHPETQGHSKEQEKKLSSAKDTFLYGFLHAGIIIEDFLPGKYPVLYHRPVYPRPFFRS